MNTYKKSTYLSAGFSIAVRAAFPRNSFHAIYMTRPAIINASAPDSILSNLPDILMITFIAAMQNRIP